MDYQNMMHQVGFSRWQSAEQSPADLPVEGGGRALEPEDESYGSPLREVGGMTPSPEQQRRRQVAQPDRAHPDSSNHPGPIDHAGLAKQLSSMRRFSKLRLKSRGDSGDFYQGAFAPLPNHHNLDIQLFDPETVALGSAAQSPSSTRLKELAQAAEPEDPSLSLQPELIKCKQRTGRNQPLRKSHTSRSPPYKKDSAAREGSQKREKVFSLNSKRGNRPSVREPPPGDDIEWLARPISLMAPTL